MKVLVTGVAGLVGSSLAKKLLSMGYQVYGVDDLSLGTRDNVPEGVEFYAHGYEKVGSFPKDIEVVFHNGARSSSPMFDPPADAFQINTADTLRLLEWSKQIGAKFMFASSSSIYGNSKLPQKEGMTIEPPSPPNFYALTKFTIENALRLYSHKYKYDGVALRYFSIFGPNEWHKRQFANLVSQYIWKRLSHEPVELYGDGTQSRDLVYVDDCVEANIKAMEYLQDGGKYDIFNVCSGKNLSGLKLCEIIDVSHRFVENPVLADYQFHTRGSPKKSKEVLGFKTRIPVTRGIKICMKAYAKLFAQLEASAEVTS